MRYHPRTLTQAIGRAAATFPAVMVTGARQTGKTTLLRHEFGESHRYVSLDRPDVRLRAQSDPLSFLAENPPPLILDEVQHVPELLPYIKERIDEDRRAGQWLLTGSQGFGLMKGVSESLAGRVAILTLDPLSVGEVTGSIPQYSVDQLLERVFGGSEVASGAQLQPGAGLAGNDTAAPHLVDWILRGGYPELRLDSRVDRQLWLSSYTQTYLERDVRNLSQVGDLGAFTRFLALVASRTGTLVNLAELGREVGVTAPTAKRWLSVLEASQVVFLLPAFHRNFGKRIRKSPKLYLLDPGLASYLMGLHEPDAVLHGPALGPLTETVVVSEWVKAFRARGERPEMAFWRSSAGHEVDIVIERSGQLFGIEVKATATPTPGHAASLAQWLELSGGRGVLACRTPHPGTLRAGIRSVPWHLAWVP
jgi:predicted AAA+ superfamily ATPase